MKKFKIYAPLDYVTGYLRYGHLEGEIEAETEEEALRIIEEEGIGDFCSVVVDSYSIEDWGEVMSIELTEEENEV